MLDEYIFLVVHADPCCSRLSVALTSFGCAVELVYGSFFGAAIFLRDIVFVLSELEASGCRPESSVGTVDSCMLAHIGECVLLSSGIKPVLDLINVTFPTRHL